MAVAAVQQFSTFQIGQLANLSMSAMGMPGTMAASGMVIRASGTMVASTAFVPRIPTAQPRLVSPFQAKAPAQLWSFPSGRPAAAGVSHEVGAMALVSSGAQRAASNTVSFSDLVAARQALTGHDATVAPQFYSVGTDWDATALSSRFLVTPAVVEALSTGVEVESKAAVTRRDSGVKPSRAKDSKSGRSFATGGYDGMPDATVGASGEKFKPGDASGPKATNDQRTPISHATTAAVAEAQVAELVADAQAVLSDSQRHFFGDRSETSSTAGRVGRDSVGDVARDSDHGDGKTAQVVELSAVMASVVRDAAAKTEGGAVTKSTAVQRDAADLPDAAVLAFPGAFDANPVANDTDAARTVSSVGRASAATVGTSRPSRADVLKVANDNRVVVDGTFGDVPVSRTYFRVVDSKTGRERLVFAGWSERRAPAVALPQGMSIESWMQILGRTAPQLIYNVAGPGGESAQRPSPGDLETGELGSRFTSALLSQISMGPKSLSDRSILDAFNSYLLGTQRLSEGDTISSEEWQMYLKEALRLAIRHTPAFNMDGLRNILHVQDDAALVLRTDLEMFRAWEQHFGTETIAEHLCEGESSPALALPDGDIRRELYLALDEALEVRAGISLDIVTDAGISQAEDTDIQWKIAIAALGEPRKPAIGAVATRIKDLQRAGKHRHAARMLALFVLNSAVADVSGRAAAREGVQDANVASKGTA